MTREILIIVEMLKQESEKRELERLKAKYCRFIGGGRDA